MTPANPTPRTAAPAPISPAAGNTGEAGEELYDDSRVDEMVAQWESLWEMAGHSDAADERFGTFAGRIDFPKVVRSLRARVAEARAAFCERSRAWKTERQRANAAEASLATSEAARETYRLQAEGAERERDAAKAEAAEMRAQGESVVSAFRAITRCNACWDLEPCREHRRPFWDAMQTFCQRISSRDAAEKDAGGGYAAPATLPHDSAPAGTSQGSDAGRPERSTGAEGTP
jgi:hypothetical protein